MLPFTREALFEVFVALFMAWRNLDAHSKQRLVFANQRGSATLEIVPRAAKIMRSPGWRSPLRGRPANVWRMSMRNNSLAPFVAIAAAAAFAAGPAAAHARLVSATPAPNSTVAVTRSLSLTFSERTVPAFSGFDVVDAAGEKIAVRTAVADDGKTLTGTLARPLAAGAYRVDWRIASSDGHRMTGSYTFTVR